MDKKERRFIYTYWAKGAFDYFYNKENNYPSDVEKERGFVSLSPKEAFFRVLLVMLKPHIESLKLGLISSIDLCFCREEPVDKRDDDIYFTGNRGEGTEILRLEDVTNPKLSDENFLKDVIYKGIKGELIRERKWDNFLSESIERTKEKR